MQEDMYGDMTGVMMTNLVSSSPGQQMHQDADSKKKREYTLLFQSSHTSMQRRRGFISLWSKESWNDTPRPQPDYFLTLCTNSYNQNGKLHVQEILP
ncbi:hypothetical protein TNCV_3023921 [Trichonephila clavipes]|nr:hypothetical protein TNCV_3023921 [Trichonephila clavipes]